MNESSSRSEKAKLLPPGDIIPFVLLASCFMWWGIANNMTDPLVQAFTGIFEGLSTFQSSLIQFAFYGAYFLLALPGAVIARKFGYKRGVLTGLALYIVGCFLFIPAAQMQAFLPFLAAFYVLAGGLSILETNANPYVLVLGPEETATQRLNLAQSFNPVGAIIGTLLAQILILAKLEAIETGATAVDDVQTAQLTIVVTPYLIVGGILLAVWLLIALTKMPYVVEQDRNVHFVSTVKRLMKIPNYLLAVVAQFFYVGAQITVWTYTVYYVPDQLGITPSETLQLFHLPALILFGIFRFISTALMSRIAPHRVLAFMAFTGVLLCAVMVWVGGIVGCYALVGVSACMSMMFPTIFGLGSRGLGEDTKIGGSGLIMAILGGAIITPMQGALVDVTSVSLSYIVPLICFAVIAVYALYAGKAKLPAAQVKVEVEQ